jgi:glutamine cyclotransferase
MQSILKLLLGIIIILVGCNESTEINDNMEINAVAAPVNINYSIVKIYPHDTSSYTQGLFWHNNKLYEGTGMRGQSKILVDDLLSSKRTIKVTLPLTDFGEGITILNNKIYQLTWQEHKVYVYNATNFVKEKEFEWPYEGWGITTNGQQLLISTGGSNIYFVNPETFKIERTLGVSDNNGYVANLNELEFVDSSIYANIWMKDIIVKINEKSGQVEGILDFSNLLQKTNQPIVQTTDVLNGIAYDAAKKSFYITGKYWPALYEVKLN